MPQVFIPEVGWIYEIKEEWKPMLEWETRNLVLLRTLGLTGTKKVSMGFYYDYDHVNNTIRRDENGVPVRKESIMNKTVPNPLFRGDDGEMVPVMVTFAPGTKLALTEIKTTYKGKIENFWFKIYESPNKKTVGKVLSVSIEQMNEAVLETYREISS